MKRADKIRLMLAHAAAAKALKDDLEYEARREVAEGTRPTWSPAGISAYASLTHDAAYVADPEAFFDYLEHHYPTEVVRREIREVRVQSWLTKMLEQWAAQGPAPRRESALPDEPPDVMDDEGSIVPGLKFKRGGEFKSFTVRPDGAVARRIAAAARRYALGVAGMDALEQAAGRQPPDDVNPVESWVHGTRLGRDHKSVRQHLIEDHGEDPDKVAGWSDGGVHGAHDGAHGKTWAYAEDLPHPPRE